MKYTIVHNCDLTVFKTQGFLTTCSRCIDINSYILSWSIKYGTFSSMYWLSIPANSLMNAIYQITDECPHSKDPHKTEKSWETKEHRSTSFSHRTNILLLSYHHAFYETFNYLFQIYPITQQQKDGKRTFGLHLNKMGKKFDQI